MMVRRIHEYGPHGLLVDCTEESPAHLAAQLRSIGIDGVVDVVPGASTVLISCRDHLAVASTQEVLDGLAPASTVTPSRNDTSTGGFDETPITLPVRFDGADLELVAEQVGESPASVIQRVLQAGFGVAFCGFAPGFAYLDGLDPRLHLPRRDTPREIVPAGSFAIAAGYAAVYPTDSPGGWHLLGTCTRPVWDPTRPEPAVLTPGRRVRFVLDDQSPMSHPGW